VLDGVRDLGARFPGARLRKVAVVRAAELDRRADATGSTRVWLALESLQVTGSFKVRGALVALDALARGPGRVVTASAGNHGAAVAYAARVLGVSATVCAPRTIPRAKRERIERLGAELVVARSDHYDDAEALGKELAVNLETAFLSAYDDPDVVLGNGASLGFEIAEAIGRVPERVCAPIGGGGLCSGLGWAMAADSPSPGGRVVWGVQSEASCAAASSLATGVAVERLETGGTTLAEGLEGGISASGFARVRAVLAGVLVVSERAIAAAMAFAYRDLGVVIEGSSATALAAVLSGLPAPARPAGGGDLALVLTGRNVDPERLEQVLREPHAG
jgi:threonine dehydratase